MSTSQGQDKMSDHPPGLFVPYSWSNPDHKVWVIGLANQVRRAGVHVVIDKAVEVVRPQFSRIASTV